MFRGIEVFRDEATASDTKYWKLADIMIGRIRGSFKIQINGQMKISRGGGVVAIDDIRFRQSECLIPVKANPQMFRCDKLPYKCSDEQHCVGEDRVSELN